MIFASLLLQDRNDLAPEFITKVSRRLSSETGRQLRSANHSSRGLEFVFLLFWRNIVGVFLWGSEFPHLHQHPDSARGFWSSGFPGFYDTATTLGRLLCFLRISQYLNNNSSAHSPGQDIRRFVESW